MTFKLAFERTPTRTFEKKNVEISPQIRATRDHIGEQKLMQNEYDAVVTNLERDKKESAEKVGERSIYY